MIEVGQSKGIKVHLKTKQNAMQTNVILVQEAIS